MSDAIIRNLIQLISAQTGLQIREIDRKDFCNKIYQRMKILKLNTVDQYYQLLLKTHSERNIYIGEMASNNEWQELVLLLTIGETYFFRDRGQLELLNNRLLPELINFKRQSHQANGKKLSLRLWSAGCSSGEEPYSLAILVKELLPDLAAWDIFILGTDINPESVEKAQQGLYDDWSFRQVDPRLKQQYFNQYKMRWQVNEQIRKMVKIRRGNLLQESFPSSVSDIHNMDIIICRNVFIYFNSQSIATVLEKFYQTLVPGGYLIAGHTELQGQKLGQLKLKAFPESIVYQRAQTSPQKPIVVDTSPFKAVQKQLSAIGTNTVIKQKLPAADLNLIHSKSVALTRTSTPMRSPANTLQTETSAPTNLSQAETLFHAGDYQKTIQVAQHIIQQQPQNFEAHYLLAQAWANVGDYKQAERCCQQALKINDLSENPYYILARIAEEKGDIEQAKNLFKKIIYLVPNSIGAYVELSYIYEREGDRDRAYKILKIVRDLLKDLPFDFAIESAHQMTASELLLQVKARLRNYK